MGKTSSMRSFRMGDRFQWMGPLTMVVTSFVHAGLALAYILYFHDILKELSFYRYIFCFMLLAGPLLQLGIVLRIRLSTTKLHLRRYLWCTIDELERLRSYRQRCWQIIRTKGLWQRCWYQVSWLGILWFFASLAVFWWAWPTLWVLLIGVSGWCLAVQGKIACEKRFCAKSSEIDQRFVNETMGRLLLMYLIPPFMLRQMDFLSSISSLSEKPFLHDFFFFLYVAGIIVIGLISLLEMGPRWIYLLLGQRVSLLPSPAPSSPWKSPGLHIKILFVMLLVILFIHLWCRAVSR